MVKRRWTCPLCDSTILGLERPRQDDVRRYCLDCSAKAEDLRLVNRVCLALEKERARKAQRRAEKAARRKTKMKRLASRRRALKKSAAPSRMDVSGRRVAIKGVDVHALAEKLLALKAWGGIFDKRPIRLDARQSATKDYSTGHAMADGRIVITFPGERHATLADAVLVLIHEMAHLAIDGRSSPHGRRWKMSYASAVEEAFGFESAMTGAHGRGRFSDREEQDLKAALELEDSILARLGMFS